MNTVQRVFLRILCSIFAAVLLIGFSAEISLAQTGIQHDGSVCGQLRLAQSLDRFPLFIPYGSNEAWFVMPPPSPGPQTELTRLWPNNWEGRYARVWNPDFFGSQDYSAFGYSKVRDLFEISKWEIVASCEPSISFTVDQDQLVQGGCTTLRWTVSNVDAIYLDGAGIGGTGTKSVCPASTTTYNLRVKSYIGEISRSIQVRVTMPPPVSSQPSPSIPSNQASQKVIVKTDRLNVRQGPGTGYRIVGSVSQGTELPVLDKNSAGNWLKVCCVNGSEGWVAAWLVDLITESEPPSSEIPWGCVGPGTCGDSQPVTQNRNAKQIRFSALDGLVTYLRIEGENQFGIETVWAKQFSPKAIVQVDDQWWQDNIVLLFHLGTQGWRGCIIEGVDQVTDHPYATVTFSTASGCHGGTASTALGPREGPEGGLITAGGDLVMCAVQGTVISRDCISFLLDVPDVVNSVLEQAQKESTVIDFESWGTWRRGDQTWGTFAQSREQTQGGSFAGKLVYDFPVVDNSFLVFQQTKAIPGSPTQLQIWVYGDGSGNFLNVWVQDAVGAKWQFTFGRVYHEGWAPMTAILNPNAGWPNGPLSGQSGSPQYPLKFIALIIDGVDDQIPTSGEIYVDDLTSN